MTFTQRKFAIKLNNGFIECCKDCLPLLYSFRLKQLNH